MATPNDHPTHNPAAPETPGASHTSGATRAPFVRQGSPIGSESLYAEARDADVSLYIEQLQRDAEDEIVVDGWREVFGPAITSLKLAAVAVSGVGLLVIFSQTIGLVREIAALPRWPAVPLFVLLGLIVALALGATARLLILYFRRAISPNLHVSLDAQLARRRKARSVAETDPTSARAPLTDFLRAYPTSREHRARLRRIGVTPREIESIIAVRDELLSAPRGDDAAWIRRIDREFLAPLDRAAAARSRRLALSVAVYTAASPRAVVDTIGVLGVSMKLLGDCCVLYNLRAGRLGSGRLLMRLIVNLAAAGAMDEAGGAIGDSAGELLREATDATSATLTGAVGVVAGKAAEGGVNALLLLRLGRAARRVLRPVRITSDIKGA